MKKVLVIKLGYSETLASFLNLGVSLGDVLRTTFILNYFKDWEVSWLVDERAKPLIENNPYIKRIFLYVPSEIEELRRERFDLVINFESLAEICKFSASIKSDRLLGFSLDGKRFQNGKDLLRSRRLIEISQSREEKRKNKLCWQEILAQVLGKKWEGERYILGYRPGSRVIYDLGFNYTTSQKWTNKAWPKSYWQKLEDLLRNRYRISWQEGLNNLYHYMEWINSCRLIVTADTLGLHLSLALGKRVVALFGPTSPQEIYFYNLGRYLQPEKKYECLPCYSLSCSQKRPCMEEIWPERVNSAIDEEFEKIRVASKV